MLTSLFISDLHLDPSRPEAIQLFDDFIREKAAKADQLFILGDLFEYWLGDDASQHSGYQSIEESLAALACKKTRVYFMHGNRDFLVGQAFSSRIGGRLLPDPTVFRLAEMDVLLMHGDSLCTDDVAHQEFRAQTRVSAWQQNILSRSIAEREELARQIRMNSIKGNTEKAESIMDVNQAAVESVMHNNEVSVLIHGHTHRTAIHEFSLGDKAAQRIVLGDWYKKGNYLIHNQHGFSLRSYPDDNILATLKLE
jgi:UDP-2,3-diacylglucosamine hydrolase